MANLKVLDGDASAKYLKSSGAGSDVDPHIPQHLETNSAAIKTAVEAIQTAVEVIDNVVAGSEAQVDIVTLPGTAEADIAAIKTAVEIIDNIVSGSEAQVDIVAELPAGTQLIGKTQPFAAMLESGITELIGINEQVDTNEFCASVGVSLGGAYSGEILGCALFTTEDDAGGIRTPTGKILFLDADPATAAGDTALTAAEWLTVFGKMDVTGGWVTDANGGFWYSNTPVPFHAMSTIYVVFLLTSATSFNDGATDDEQLEMNLWIRRDS